MRLMSACIAFVLLFAGLLAGRGAGAVAVTPDCGVTIASSVTLTRDIGPCSSGGLTVQTGSTGVVIDMHGFKLYGTSSTGDGDGIHADSVSGLVIENGTISGFDEGARVLTSTGTTVSGMHFLGNVGVKPNSGDGFFDYHSSATTVKNSDFEQNGPFSGAALDDGLNPANVSSSKFIGNSGDGLDVTAQDAVVKGVQAKYNSGIGIRMIGSGNHLTSSTSNSNGFGGLSSGVAISGPNAVVKKVTVNGNGKDGIELAAGTTGAHLTRNAAKHDGLAVPGYGFYDPNACGTNVWKQNKGTKNQPCMH